MLLAFRKLTGKCIICNHPNDQHMDKMVTSSLMILPTKAAMKVSNAVP